MCLVQTLLAPGVARPEGSERARHPRPWHAACMGAGRSTLGGEAKCEEVRRCLEEVDGWTGHLGLYISIHILYVIYI